MHFIERVKNCRFVNCYGVLKNIRFELFSELSLLCERTNPKNWKIYKYSLKMNNYYPHLYIIYGMFGRCKAVDKTPVFVRKTSQNRPLCKLFSYVKRNQIPETIVVQGIPPSPLQVYYTTIVIKYNI